MFDLVEDIDTESPQMTLIKSQQLYVMGFYHSKRDTYLSSELSHVILAHGPYLKIGDFNICSQKTPNDQVILNLRSLGFILLLNEATHFEGGYPDKAWIRNHNSNRKIDLYNLSYNCKDHYALLFTTSYRSTKKVSPLMGIPYYNSFFRYGETELSFCTRRV